MSQALGAIAVGVGGLVSSIAMGYTSPALPSMRADPNFNITEEQVSPRSVVTVFVISVGYCRV